MTRFVRTLAGDIPPTALGRTLIHEHLTVDWGEMHLAQRRGGPACRGARPATDRLPDHYPHHQ